ncbi:hypothetical protein FJT64_014938 [Amphibalanus amphitrite]|uniref:Single domain-containing protein n=1 Tax=Amphibalanus amphitrite TaxID=1232801 RepID=A0A6A4XE05_AMPAM|nr:uncharacterized protein LOC122389106 [Amphibalanus amphitrite]KAF0314600.1 hypothetical protein FJT64_014938 [Amphibalanus amphitrite]
MWKLLVVTALAALQLADGQHVHSYYKFPVAPGHENECQDDQTDKFYSVGSSWATTTNDCKKSSCVREGNSLFIDRVQCDPVDQIIAQLKELSQTQEGGNILCRQASGDRRKPFPGCCPRPLCKKRVGSRLVRIPSSEYPVLPDQVTYS